MGSANPLTIAGILFANIAQSRICMSSVSLFTPLCGKDASLDELARLQHSTRHSCLTDHVVIASQS